MRSVFVAALIGLVGIVLMLGLATPPTSAQTLTGAGLRLVKSDTTSVIFELSVPTYALARRTINSSAFDALSAPGTEPNTDVPGNPQLPIRGVLVAVPQGADISVRVLSQEAVEIPGRVNLLPIPTPRIDRKGFDTASYTFAGVDYTQNRQSYARNSFEPASPARLGKTGFLRSQRFAQITLFPFQYNAAQQRVRWLKRLTVEVQFTFPRGQSRQTVGESRAEGAFERVLQNQILNYSAARSWRAPRAASAQGKKPSVAPGDFKIAINQTGVYRLTYAALTAAGVPTSVDPRTFKIKKNGSEIPSLVNNESSGIFDSSVSIDFYGLGLNTVYTDTNVYWLSHGGANGLRMPTRDATPSASPPVATTFRDRLHLEEGHYNVGDRPNGTGDHWYWNGVGTFPPPNSFFLQSPAVYTFTLTDANNSGTGVLRSNVFGAATGVGAAFPHHEKIFINGNLVTDEAWQFDDAYQIESPFPQSNLISGTNTISYTLPNDTGMGYDAVFMNWFELEYDHVYAARNDYLAFASDVTGTIQLTATNFVSNNVSLYDVTDPGNVVRLTNFGVASDSGSYALAFGDNLVLPAHYVALTNAALKSPLSITRDSSASDLRNGANGADEIIIAYDDFYAATEPLATFRSSQGLRVMRVKISDVYDEFSDGVFDPTAMRSFLSYAYANWQAPAPAYVLLVGDGTLNYRNYYPNNVGAIEPNYIPPYLDAIDPFINETATDNRFVNLVGNDLVPDMAIGRLPVRSVAETTGVINKIIAFEQAPPPGDWRTTIGFITDNYYTSSGGTDSAGNFYATADGIIAGYIPSAYAFTRAYYDPAPSPPNPGDPWHYPSVAAERDAITTALNASGRFINYLGHGSQFQWAGENLFGNSGSSSNLFDSINNGGRTPIVLELTCKTGMFHLPGITTLAESFIRANGQGAVADWSSTGLGVNDGHDLLAQGFYTAVFTDSVGTLGLAINSSKTSLVASGLHWDLVDEFTLFGDPATAAIPFPRIRFYLPVILR